MRKETRDLLRGLNEVLDEWDEYNLTSNKVNQTKDLLEEFYNKYGKHVKDSERFSTRIRLNEEQEQELLDIAQNMAFDDRSFVETYEDDFEEMETLTYDKPLNIDAFNKMKEQYGDYFEDLSDYVHFFDVMDVYKNDEYLSHILSSQQYVSLMNYGSEDIDEGDLNRIIIEQYLSTGLEKNSLYNKVLGLIS